MNNDVCEKACAILEATSDGESLGPRDLYLLQLAVNKDLSDVGMKRFNTLHQEVMAGTYTPPWLHGVEHITKDHEGYVYYKGKSVEHFSFGENSAGEKAAAENLQKKCKLLESRGVQINTTNAVWRFDEVIGCPEPVEVLREAWLW